jgi:hypothetical protein
MKRIVLSFISLTLALSGLAPVVALAASPAGEVPREPLSLQTSPLPINLSVDPGKSVTTELKVKQNGSQGARLKVSLMKFEAFGEEGKPRILDREPGDDYFDWVKFDRPVFDAPPNVWQTVKMTINTPKTAAFGYYYAAVFSRVGDDEKPDGRANAISGATATLVLLDAKSPNAKRVLDLGSLTSKHRIYEFLPAEFDVRLTNRGNVHAVPQGNVFITKGGKEVGILSFNAAGGAILPDSNRVYPAMWDSGFPVYKEVVENEKVKVDSKGRQVKKLTWDWTQANKFRMGKYKAHLFAIYDDGHRDVPIEAELTFWVIPWRFLLVVLVVLVLVGFGTYMIVRGSLRSAMRGWRRFGRRR